jgi:hypothetical protein
MATANSLNASVLSSERYATLSSSRSGNLRSLARSIRIEKQISRQTIMSIPTASPSKKLHVRCITCEAEFVTLRGLASHRETCVTHEPSPLQWLNQAFLGAESLEDLRVIADAAIDYLYQPEIFVDAWFSDVSTMIERYHQTKSLQLALMSCTSSNWLTTLFQCDTTARDVSVFLDTGSSKVLVCKAHSLVLSDYSRIVLTPTCATHHQQPQQRQYEFVIESPLLRDVPLDIANNDVEQLIASLYCIAPTIAVDNVAALCAMALLFNVKHLREQCLEFLVHETENVSLRNCISLMTMADLTSSSMYANLAALPSDVETRRWKEVFESCLKVLRKGLSFLVRYDRYLGSPSKSPTKSSETSAPVLDVDASSP